MLYNLVNAQGIKLVLPTKLLFPSYDLFHISVAQDTVATLRVDHLLSNTTTLSMEDLS